MYSTVEEIKNVLTETTLLELTNSNKPEDIIPIIESAIKIAQGEIDSYIALVAYLPLENIPEVLRGISIKLTVYHLLSSKNVIDKNSIHRLEYEDAIKKLCDIRERKITIPPTVKKIKVYALGAK